MCDESINKFVRQRMESGEDDRQPYNYVDPDPDDEDMETLKRKKLSQTDRLLAHFRTGGKITSFEAYLDFGITQLGRCIDDLQKRGFRFNKPTINVNGKKVVQYSLCVEKSLLWS